MGLLELPKQTTSSVTTMRSFSLLFVCLALLFASCLCDGVATQQQQTQQQASSGQILPGSPDADTTYVFPDVNEEEGFYPGSISHVVLGFKNQGQRPYGFTGIGGSLYYYMDSSYVLENYTAIKYDVTIQPGEEFSFTYPFRLHPMLSEGQYGLRFTALYRDEFNTYASTFFNETIHVLEPHRELHIQDILQFGLIIVVLGLAVFGIVKYVGGSRKQKFSNKAVEEHNPEDWLPDHIKKKNKKKKKKKNSKKKKKKKKKKS